MNYLEKKKDVGSFKGDQKEFVKGKKIKSAAKI